MSKAYRFNRLGLMFPAIYNGHVIAEAAAVIALATLFAVTVLS